MANIVIIHGTGGNPEENWFPWLKAELIKLGHQVIVPRFPTPENQSLKNWLDIFAKYTDFLNKDSIVIGHSLGPVFLLSVLENLHHSIKSAFFVASFISPLNLPEFDELNKTFTQRNFNWKGIKNHCRHFEVIHSDNDPYVPLAKAEDLAKQLGVEVTLVPGAAHFNTAAGYSTFPLLLERVTQLLR